MLGTVCAIALWSGLGQAACTGMQAAAPHIQLQPPVHFVATTKPIAAPRRDYSPSYLVIAPEIQIGRDATGGRNFRFSVAHMSGTDFLADDVITGEDWVRAVYRFHS